MLHEPLKSEILGIEFFVAIEFLGIANHLIVLDTLYIAACFTIILCLLLIALKDQLGKAFTESRFVNRPEFF